MEVPNEALSSLDSFNQWLVNNGAGTGDGALKNSSTNYTISTYIEGDFNTSVDYYRSLVNNADIGTRTYNTGKGGRHTTEIKNWDYSVSSNNCMTTSQEGLKLGVLHGGTKVANFATSDSIIPNTYRDVIKNSFGNSSFYKSTARTQVYNNSGRSYKTGKQHVVYNGYLKKQKRYANMIGVR